MVSAQKGAWQYQRVATCLANIQWATCFENRAFTPPAVEDLVVRGFGWNHIPSGIGTIRFLTKLDLSGCWQLVDISALGNIPTLHTLNLSSCRQLVDMSALGDISILNTLDLRGCSQLVDMSALDNIHTLSL